MYLLEISLHKKPRHKDRSESILRLTISNKWPRLLLVHSSVEYIFEYQKLSVSDAGRSSIA
jgi:hypothetical protein